MPPGELCRVGSFSPDFSLTGVSEAGRTDSSPSAMPLVSSKRGSFGTARGVAQSPVQPASAQVLFNFHLPVGMLPGGSAPSPMSTAEIDALLTAALALPLADGLRQWTCHTLFGLIAVTGMRITEAMGPARGHVDLDAGVLTSSRKVVIAGPNAVRSMRAPRENASEWIEVRATIVRRRAPIAASDQRRGWIEKAGNGSVQQVFSRRGEPA